MSAAFLLPAALLHAGHSARTHARTHAHAAAAYGSALARHSPHLFTQMQNLSCEFGLRVVTRITLFGGDFLKYGTPFSIPAVQVALHQVLLTSHNLGNPLSSPLPPPSLQLISVLRTEYTRRFQVVFMGWSRTIKRSPAFSS